MSRYVIYRDDYDYPIEANTIEELRELRAQGNQSFMSHGYGSVCLDVKTNRYYNIYNKQEVASTEARW